MFLWEETGKCTRGTHRGKGPGTGGKTCGDNVGKGEIRPSGILGGLAETWAMVELGTRRTY
jgi:hypothetical protein